MGRVSKIVGLTMLVATIATSACKNSSSSTTPDPAPPCTGTSCGAVYPFGSGGTTVLNVVNNTVLSQYQGTGTWITPTSTVYLNVNTSPIADSSGNTNYMGTMHIQYYVGTQDHKSSQSSGTDPSHGNNVNQCWGNTCRLFFEDPLGIIIIVANSDTGTDTNFGTLNGQVYFRNFSGPGPNPLYEGGWYGGTWFNQNPYAYCWTGIITAGPYDCRNTSVPPLTTGDYAVTLLGTFTGLDKKAAFGL